jgi:FHS family glucose/mannose:H+ symporter-like MFS transporter
MYRKNLVFFAACFGMLLFGIVFLSLGSVNNMLAERFHLDNNRIGTLTALLPLGILAGSLIFGPIVDRFGYKWMLIACSLLVLIGLEGIAFGQSEGAIRLYIFLIGFGGGVLNGATNALVADVSEGERGAKLSLLGVFFGIGAVGMPFALAALTQDSSGAGGFSNTSIVAAIGALVSLPIIYFCVIRFPPPKQKQSSFSFVESLASLKAPILLTAGIVLAFQSGMEGMSNDWTTRYFKKVIFANEHDIKATEHKCLYALAALAGAMTVTRLILGALLKKASSVLVLYLGIGFAAVGSMIVMSGTNYAVALVGMALIGIGLSACFPVVLGYIGDLYPANSGMVFSTIFVLALLGNMTINKALGFIAEKYGIHQYTKVMLVCLLFSAAFLFLLIRQLNKTKSCSKTNEQSRETMVG